VRTISASQLLARLDDDGDHLTVLDVREPDEFEAWSIPGARNVPLGQLGDRRSELDADRDVVAVCAVGSRATLAAEQLGSDGIDALVLDGGMQAWSRVYDEAELQLAGATIVQVRRRGKGCLSYVIGAAGRAVVVDPSGDLDEYVSRCEDRGWTITHVLDTHLHADHVSGARALAAATDAELCLNPLDSFEYPHTDLADGGVIRIGADVELDVAVLSTPGHTLGSTTFTLGDAAVFTGDVLFLESVGRPDLADQAEAFAHALYRSLHDRIFTLADTAYVLPAHAGGDVVIRGNELVTATLGALRNSLWQLESDERGFVDWAVSSVAVRPPSYATIVEMNRTGSAVDPAVRADLEAGPNRCAIAS
jgi:glyoxylase-like metal-dependent hydrolase (beta-lactamase superfamily II)